MIRRLLAPVRGDRSIGVCLVLALVGAWPAGAAAYSSPSLYAADPVRFGVDGLVDRLIAEFPETAP